MWARAALVVLVTFLIFFPAGGSGLRTAVVFRAEARVIGLSSHASIVNRAEEPDWRCVDKHPPVGALDSAKWNEHGCPWTY